MMAGEEFGITCYYDENTYLTFGPSKTDEGIQLTLKEHVGDTDKVEGCISEKILPGTDLCLRVVTEGLRRSFYVKTEGADWECAAVLPRVDYLCDEGWHIGKRFTGAMEGIYARTCSAEERLIHFSRF